MCQKSIIDFVGIRSTFRGMKTENGFASNRRDIFTVQQKNEDFFVDLVKRQKC